MQMLPNPDESAHVIQTAMEDLENRTRKIGLYQLGYTVGLDNPQDAQKLETGEATPVDLLRSGSKMMVLASYNIGDMAFDTAVVQPEEAAIQKEAQMLLPSEAEMTKERIAKLLAEGKDLEDLFDDDMD